MPTIARPNYSCCWICGETIAAKPTAAPTGKVIDLMAALEASLAAVKKPEKAKTGKKKQHAR